MKTYKKGISLIVLVITVLVLAILATTVIVSLSNTNIIQQAQDAKNKSDFAQFKQAMNLEYASWLADSANRGKTFTQADADAIRDKYTEFPDNYIYVVENGVPNAKNTLVDEDTEESGDSAEVAAAIAAAYPGVTGITSNMIMPASVFTYSYSGTTATITGYAGSVTISDCMSYTLDSDTLQAMTTAITAAGGKYIVPYEVVNNGTTYTISGAFSGDWAGPGDWDGNDSIEDGETKYTYTMFSDAASTTATEVVLPATVNSFSNHYATPAKVTITAAGTVTLDGSPGNNVTYDILNATSLAAGTWFSGGNSYDCTFTINVPASVTSISSTLLSNFEYSNTKIVMNINKAQNSISGSPWGMPNVENLTVNWAQ